MIIFIVLLKIPDLFIFYYNCQQKDQILEPLWDRFVELRELEFRASKLNEYSDEQGTQVQPEESLLFEDFYEGDQPNQEAR